MRTITGILTLLLSLSLLTGCGGQPQAGDPPPTKPLDAVDGGGDDLTREGPSATLTCRIVDGAESGNLILARADGTGGDVYTLSVTDSISVLRADGSSGRNELRDGMIVHVRYSGDILETYPAQLASVSAIEMAENDVDDRCGLYLQVLEDLWNVDPGLNADITELGVDLSGLTDLSDGEKSAVAWHFGELHGLTPIEGTWAELCEQGYIDRENLYWEDGCLFSLTTDTEAVWSLPMLEEGEEPPTLTAFDAQKWRSGDGAYFFCDCVGQMAENGTWTYTVGSEAIS